MSFPARYPGTCTECGARFHAGDPIRHAETTQGWAHASCTEDHPDPEPCLRCWLTICDCDKDTR